jgi:hypothetical protein
MTDVTRKMLAYRECARGVWNDYLRPEAEPGVDFDAVDVEAQHAAVVFDEASIPA